MDPQFLSFLLEEVKLDQKVDVKAQVLKRHKEDQQKRQFLRNLAHDVDETVETFISKSDIEFICRKTKGQIFISGGTIPNLYNINMDFKKGNSVDYDAYKGSDLDFYCTNRETRKMLVRKLKSLYDFPSFTDSNGNICPHGESHLAFNFRVNPPPKLSKHGEARFAYSMFVNRLQVIKQIGTPKQIFENYDFEHLKICRFLFDEKTRFVIDNRDIYNLLENKILKSKKAVKQKRFNKWNVTRGYKTLSEFPIYIQREDEIPF